MTNIEQKALVLVEGILPEDAYRAPDHSIDKRILWNALCRAIEQHEAFCREVSDEIAKLGCWPDTVNLQRFIIAKPDPLVEAWEEVKNAPLGEDRLEVLRAALAKRGLEIVEKKK